MILSFTKRKGNEPIQLTDDGVETSARIPNDLSREFLDISHLQLTSNKRFWALDSTSCRDPQRQLHVFLNHVFALMTDLPRTPYCSSISAMLVREN